MAARGCCSIQVESSLGKLNRNKIMMSRSKWCAGDETSDPPIVSETRDPIVSETRDPIVSETYLC
jgi:hypothetical protein